MPQFQKYTLLMQTAFSQNIWACMEEVSRLQDRSTCFLGLYQKYITRSDEENEFLSNDPPQDNIDPRHDSPTHAEKPQLAHPCLESRKVLEEQIEFEPRMNLSRIFEDISLGDEVRPFNSTGIEVQLELESGKCRMSLGKCDNTYNLSNFSSFNNQKSNDNFGNFQIKDLLVQIQEKTGRQLTRAGIQNIINQIEMKVAVELEARDKMQESEITQHSLKASCVNPNPAFTPRIAFDFELEEKELKEIKDNKNIEEHRACFEKKEQGKAANLDHSHSQNKENSQLHYKKKKALPAPKELRILRKNNPKSSLVMTYTDIKQLENFCISNKIYGKEKERIAKAIRDGKNIISLD